MSSLNIHGFGPTAKQFSVFGYAQQTRSDFIFFYRKLYQIIVILLLQWGLKSAHTRVRVLHVPGFTSPVPVSSESTRALGISDLEKVKKKKNVLCHNP